MRKYLSHCRSIIAYFFHFVPRVRRTFYVPAKRAAAPAPGDTPRALRYFDGRMLTPSTPPRETEVFDAIEVAAELERLAGMHAGNHRELRIGGCPPHQGRADRRDAPRPRTC